MNDNTIEQAVIPEVIRAEATIPAETAVALRSGAGAVASMQHWTIDCAEVAQIVTDEVVTLETKARQLDDARKSITEPLHKAWKNANAVFMPAISALQEAAGVGRTKLLTWRRAEEARIAEERRAAEEIARKARQEAEAIAAAAQARAEEEARIARERAAEAEAARKKAEAEGNARAAAAAAAQAAAANAKAAAALENGQAKAEAALIEASAAAPVVPVAPVMPKGTGAREKWEARLEDKPDAMHRLVKYIAANPQFLGLVKLDQGAANKLAASLKAALAIDGLVVVDVGSLTIRKTIS